MIFYNLSHLGTKRSAFTLIELILVIMILSVIAGIGYTSLSRARTNVVFKQAVNETVGIIQDARAKAMANAEILGEDGATVYSATSFYIKINTDLKTLSLFADLGDTAQLMERVTLDPEVTITVEPNETELFYTPPMGELTFDPASPSGEVIITLSMADGTLTKTITVDQFRGMPEIIE